MKHYVVCMDGTWNRPGQKDPDPISGTESLTTTNVFRVFQGLTGVSPDLRNSYGQTSRLWSENGGESKGEAIYFAGVGTQPGTKYFEGLTGWGLAQRIADAYRFLGERYRAGDKIFGFGFSRGALAIRSLAGLIQYAGLPEDPQLAGNVDELYQRYGARGISDRFENSGHRARTVDFLGLWDTVGSLIGPPFDHDIHPSNVLRVAHALALDEQRDDFSPEYWFQSNGFADSQLINEVWFSGAHSNVGGGYTDDNLSNIAFFWVMNEAVSAGLDARLPCMPWWVREKAGGILRSENRRFFWKLRALFMSASRSPTRQVTRGQRVHESVIDRIRDRTLQPPYIPKATHSVGFWESIDRHEWQHEWLEGWGFDEPTEGELGFEEQTYTVMTIPNKLVSKVHELILNAAAEEG